MKRLIRKAFGQTLYHGTTLDRLKSITEAGMIMPQESGGAGLAPDNEFDAKQRAFNRLYNEGLRPDTPEYNEKFNVYMEEEYDKEKQKLNGFTFFTDNMNLAKEYSGSTPLVVIEVSLPEDSLLPDDNDCPECRNWRESLRFTSQIKVPGLITDDYIVGVYIYDELNVEGKFFSKLTWIDNYKQNENL